MNTLEFKFQPQQLEAAGPLSALAAACTPCGRAHQQRTHPGPVGAAWWCRARAQMDGGASGTAPGVLSMLTCKLPWLQVRAAPGQGSDVHILFRDLQGAAAAQRALNGAFIPTLTGAQLCSPCGAMQPASSCTCRF